MLFETLLSTEHLVTLITLKTFIAVGPDVSVEVAAVLKHLTAEAALVNSFMIASLTQRSLPHTRFHRDGGSVSPEMF